MTLQDLLALKAKQQPPTKVVLCGSTRFSEAFQQATLSETLAGRIVLSIGCHWHSDEALGLTEEDKERLDTLHLFKIDEASEILVLNVNDYVGSSTANEIQYAARQGKRIRWLEPPSLEHLALLYANYHCEQCQALGVVEEAMDTFVACLCKECYERLNKEYIEAMSRPGEEVAS